MKKYLFIAAAATLVFASCTKNEVTSVNEALTPTISFGTYSPRNLTKADAANYAAGATLIDAAQFDVYGWYTANGTSFTGSNGAQFMDWYTVTYKTGGNTNGNGKTNLYPDGYRYWPTGATPNYLSFYAYYPSNAGTITPAAGLGAFTFTAENEAKDQVDFMVSDVVKDQTYSTANGNPGTNNHVDGEVHLTFRHMLTKVKFRFKTTADVANSATSKIEVYLKDAKLSGIRNAGTLTSSFNGTATSTEWSAQSGNQGYEIFINGGDIPTDPGQLLTDDPDDAASADADLFLMVPQAMVDKAGANPQALYLKWDIKDLVTGVITENEATVYFKNDLKNGDDPDAAGYDAKEIDWTKNMFVTYTITIGPKPILFTAEAASWAAEQSGYFNIN